MVTVTEHGLVSTQNALAIPRLTHAEAGRLAAAELDRVIALVESLSGDDWSQPTDCTEWTVRDMVAHLAGACAAYASWGEFRHQMLLNPYLRTMSPPIDAVNHRQIEDRADKTPAELVAELREAGPKAVRNRQRAPWLLRVLRMPLGAPLGFAPVGYLLDTIYPRDQWMHRADICRATGKTMRLTAEHDGRMVALVLRDLALALRREAMPAPVSLALSSEAGGEYHFGTEGRAEVSITLDVLQFNRLASGRITPDEALSTATATGDAAIVRWFFEHSDVPF